MNEMDTDDSIQKNFMEAKMSLNNSKIEWTDFTWNPVTGCLNGCPYCYARKISMRFNGHFNPTYHPDRLVDPYKLRKPSKIFACSMGELFGDWIPDNWIGNVLLTIANNHKHIFQILTKCPHNLIKWEKFFPPNLYLGVSVARQEDIGRIFHLRMTAARTKVISFEPLLGPINTNLDGIDWLIIGSQTRPMKIPKKEWVQTLLDQARDLNIPIFLKDNLYFESQIREFPTSRSSE